MRTLLLAYSLQATAPQILAILVNFSRYKDIDSPIFATLFYNLPAMPLSSLATSLISSIVASILESGDAPSADMPAEQPGVASIAVFRAFPEQALVGRISGPPQNSYVNIDGKVLRVVPATQFRDENNRLVLPVSLRFTGNRIVRYQLDVSGNLWRVWFLTQTEIAALKNLPPQTITTLPGILNR